MSFTNYLQTKSKDPKRTVVFEDDNSISNLLETKQKLVESLSYNVNEIKQYLGDIVTGKNTIPLIKLELDQLQDIFNKIEDIDSSVKNYNDEEKFNQQELNH